MALTFKAEIEATFSVARVTVDDGESVVFRSGDFWCGARLLSNGKWTIEVRDLHGISFEQADFEHSNRSLSKQTTVQSKVVPLMRELANQLRSARMPIG